MRLDPKGEVAKALKLCRKGKHEQDVAAALRYAHHGALNYLAKAPVKKVETYEEQLDRNIRERHRRERAGIRGMWGARV
jgi:DNA-binding Lrp family transcriptional regulator